MDTLLLVLILIAVYVFVWVYVRKSTILQEKGIVPYGPTIMLKTQAGKGLMERLAAPRRFWKGYALLSKIIVFSLMIIFTGLLLWQMTIIHTIPKESALGPEYILGIPGLNPIIPIGYGIVALIICIVIHEVAHGILTRVNGMDIKTTGLLFLIFPIGAFVEPDEEQLINAGKKERSDVYAVGPATNFIVAIILVLILTIPMLGAVETQYPDNPVVVVLSDGSPAEHAGLDVGTVIISMGGVEINTIDDFYNYNASNPGELAEIKVVTENGEDIVYMVTGVYIESATKGQPAYESGVRAGMLLYSIDGQEIRGISELNKYLSNTTPGQVVELVMLEFDEDTSTWENSYFEVELTSGPLPKGYLGITMNFAGIGINTPSGLLAYLKDPLQGSETLSDMMIASLSYLALPFIGLAPMPTELTWLFETGWILDGDLFWIVANTFYWVFWMNLMIALTNSLPAIPLDGGYLFMDAVDYITKKLRPAIREEERQRLVESVTTWLALPILFMIIWQFVGPRIA